MGKIREILPVKLLFSVFTNNNRIMMLTEKKISEFFGNIELISDKFIFNHTNYYEDEFGKALFRKIFVIKSLFHRDGIEKVKIITNEMENDFSTNGRRVVNIDPGYISLENFILFTTKNYTHRIYLSKGIFADLTLIFQNKTFNPLPWTSPDYASHNIKNFLKNIIKQYSVQIRDAEEIKNAKTVI